MKIWTDTLYTIYHFFMWIDYHIATPIARLVLILIYRRDKLAEMRKNFHKEWYYCFRDPKTSFSIDDAQKYMVALLAFIGFSIGNFVSLMIGEIWMFTGLLIPGLLILGITSLGTNYYLLWKDDRYLIRFKELDKLSRKEKRTVYIKSTILIFSIISFLCGSFWIMNHFWKR